MSRGLGGEIVDEAADGDGAGAECAVGNAEFRATVDVVVVVDEGDGGSAVAEASVFVTLSTDIVVIRLWISADCRALNTTQ